MSYVRVRLRAEDQAGHAYVNLGSMNVMCTLSTSRPGAQESKAAAGGIVGGGSDALSGLVLSSNFIVSCDPK